jgi:beta-lactamase class A
MNPAVPVPSPGIIATPPAFATPQPTPSSERSVLRDGLVAAGAQARALDGMLGAVVIDLTSGAVGELNGDVSLPMESVQKLLIAIVAYEEADRNTLPLDRVVTIDPADVVTTVSPIGAAYATTKSYTVRQLIGAMLVDSDNTAANALIRAEGGIDALNAAIRDLGFEKIVAGADDKGVATPVELARVLTELSDGHLLRSASRTALLSTLARVQTFPNRLRAGLPDHSQLAHKTGTSVTLSGVTAATNDVGIATIYGRRMIVVAMLSGAKGTPEQRDAILAAVARAAAGAVSSNL